MTDLDDNNIEDPLDWMYHSMTCAHRRIGPSRGPCDCGATGQPGSGLREDPDGGQPMIAATRDKESSCSCGLAAQLAATHAAIRALPRYNCDCLPQNSKGEMWGDADEDAKHDPIYCQREIVLWEALARLLGEEKPQEDVDARVDSQ